MAENCPVRACSGSSGLEKVIPAEDRPKSYSQALGVRAGPDSEPRETPTAPLRDESLFFIGCGSTSVCCSSARNDVPSSRACRSVILRRGLPDCQETVPLVLKISCWPRRPLAFCQLTLSGLMFRLPLSITIFLGIGSYRAARAICLTSIVVFTFFRLSPRMRVPEAVPSTSLNFASCCKKPSCLTSRARIGGKSFKSASMSIFSLNPWSSLPRSNSSSSLRP